MALAKRILSLAGLVAVVGVLGACAMSSSSPEEGAGSESVGGQLEIALWSKFSIDCEQPNTGEWKSDHIVRDICVTRWGTTAGKRLGVVSYGRWWDPKTHRTRLQLVTTVYSNAQTASILARHTACDVPYVEPGTSDACADGHCWSPCSGVPIPTHSCIALRSYVAGGDSPLGAQGFPLHSDCANAISFDPYYMSSNTHWYPWW